MWCHASGASALNPKPSVASKRSKCLAEFVGLSRQDIAPNPVDYRALNHKQPLQIPLRNIVWPPNDGDAAHTPSEQTGPNTQKSLTNIGEEQALPRRNKVKEKGATKK